MQKNLWHKFLFSIYSCHFVFGGNNSSKTILQKLLCKWFCRSKFIILFSYNGIGPWMLGFDLNSTKFYSKLLFVSFKENSLCSFHFKFNFKRSFVIVIFQAHYIISLLVKAITGTMFSWETNNVKGLQSSKKQLKRIEYLKK